MEQPKTDLVIIGAQKAGTTSLLRYLGEHPEICAHPQKEFAFYLRPQMYNHNYSEAFTKYFADYNPFQHKKIVSKSAGLYTETDALKLLYRNNPEVKVVLILRDPVERIYSAWVMEKNAGEVSCDFPEYIEKMEDKDNLMNAYLLKFTDYVTHLKAIREIFPEKNIRVILYEELKNNSLNLCRSLFSWIGVDPEFRPQTKKIHNQSYQTRSGIIAKAIHWLLKNNNPIKRILLFFIPKSKAYKLGDAIRRTNQKNNPVELPDPECIKKLRLYYNKQVTELEQMLNTELSNWK